VIVREGTALSVWCAQQEIHALSADNSNKQRVIQLSKEYSIPCKYTSFVVVGEESQIVPKGPLSSVNLSVAESSQVVFSSAVGRTVQRSASLESQSEVILRGERLSCNKPVVQTNSVSSPTFLQNIKSKLWNFATSFRVSRTTSTDTRYYSSDSQMNTNSVNHNVSQEIKTDELIDLIKLQEYDGRWCASKITFLSCENDKDATQQMIDHICLNFGSREDEWRMVIQKAREYLQIDVLFQKNVVNV